MRTYMRRWRFKHHTEDNGVKSRDRVLINRDHDTLVVAVIGGALQRLEYSTIVVLLQSS